jgi:DNA mismatch repair ATPase MutS
LQAPEGYDRHHFILPLANVYAYDKGFRRGLEAMARIDELLSFHRYSEAMGPSMVIPTVGESGNHYFVAKGVRNPTTAKGNSHHVPNDVSLNGQRLTIITGSNSGGKTTICKTIAQMQLLGQIGCYVPAREAEMRLADRIFYQVPGFDSLIDEEGRFGTELKGTKEIFLDTTPKSLVILDDCLAGSTTQRESTEISYSILDGFHTIGNNTLFVTHNIELADMLCRKEKGQFLQVEFKDGRPTYRILQGISMESHAADIAKRIGFSPEDIRNILGQEGI